MVPLSLLADLIAYPAALIIAAWPEDDLVRWSWFLTPDNPATGDEAHEARWRGRPRYFQKVAWLWRNKAYGFSKTVLGARTNGPVTLWSSTDRPVGNKAGRVEGLEIRTTPEGYWQLYYIKRVPWGRSKCLRVNLGWKIWNNELNAHPTFGMLVFTVNPFRTFEGE